MKATMSRDGKYRINLRVTHRVGVDSLTDVLAFHYRNYIVSEQGPLPDLSRTRLIREVKEELAMSGWEYSAYWREHVSDWDVETWEDWAREQVINVFPELADE
ncbi:hypothetical protein [Streptomyces sp. NPDC047097]|uniref:hypothetical protein n=1 Tax=Streptomyces sp. NPDC047097 TaxID=3155260 RepID=UPI0033FEFDAD